MIKFVSKDGVETEIYDPVSVEGADPNLPELVLTGYQQMAEIKVKKDAVYYKNPDKYYQGIARLDEVIRANKKIT